MIPPLIVQKALEKGINLMAITDHNASANVVAVQKAAQDTGLTVLPGMELQTREEVHLLCLFDTLEQLAAWQALVDAHLPPLENNIEYFGEQFVVDETGEFIRRETQLLLTSADLSLEEAIGAVNCDRGAGDPGARRSQSVRPAGNSRLRSGGCPDRGAGDFAAHLAVDVAPLRYPQIRGYPLVRGGDAHRLNEFLGVNEFLLESPRWLNLRWRCGAKTGGLHRFRSAELTINAISHDIRRLSNRVK